jgi:small subunit ribosomal protein S21
LTPAEIAEAETSRIPQETRQRFVLVELGDFTHMQVFVRDNNVEQALRVLKKKMQREGVFREMRRAAFYEKPSEKAAREKSEAIRRARKLARKQAIREGLIAAPVKKPNDRRPTRALPSVAPAEPKLP